MSNIEPGGQARAEQRQADIRSRLTEIDYVADNADEDDLVVYENASGE